MATATANKKSTSESTKTTTRYMVQMRLGDQTLDHPKINHEGVFADIGVFEAPSGQKQKAVAKAMELLGVDSGDFRAVPESSLEVLKPRPTTGTRWE